MPGTQKRVPLFDKDGERIRGKENKEVAELALAREKLTWEDGDQKTPGSDGPWLVVRVCSECIQYCERGVTGVTNPLKGLKKPRSQPRLVSFSPEDEKALYDATEECFESFLFAGIHTGLRPFCELARITADDVEESDRGMMWRVYSSKTKKPCKISVRPEVAELARKLMKTAPKGSGLPLFRNTRGGLDQLDVDVL